MQLKPRAAGWAAVMVVALFLAGTLGFWAFDYNQRRALAGSHTSERAIAAGYALTRQIHSVFSDLAYLSQQQRLVRFRPEFREDRVALENSWQLYLERHPYLEQIRYLDSLGREQVRVERRGGEVVAIAEPQLQDKAKRYYFLDAMALAPGQIYLSPLDLNVEYGVLDRPYRAMMRFILASGAGHARGAFRHAGVKRQRRLPVTAPDRRRRRQYSGAAGGCRRSPVAG